MGIAESPALMRPDCLYHLDKSLGVPSSDIFFPQIGLTRKISKKYPSLKPFPVIVVSSPEHVDLKKPVVINSTLEGPYETNCLQVNLTQVFGGRPAGVGFPIGLDPEYSGFVKQAYIESFPTGVTVKDDKFIFGRNQDYPNFTGGIIARWNEDTGGITVAPIHVIPDWSNYVIGNIYANYGTLVNAGKPAGEIGLYEKNFFDMLHGEGSYGMFEEYLNFLRKKSTQISSSFQEVEMRKAVLKGKDPDSIAVTLMIDRRGDHTSLKVSVPNLDMRRIDKIMRLGVWYGTQAMNGGSMIDYAVDDTGIPIPPDKNFTLEMEYRQNFDQVDVTAQLVGVGPAGGRQIALDASSIWCESIAKPDSAATILSKLELPPEKRVPELEAVEAAAPPDQKPAETVQLPPGFSVRDLTPYPQHRRVKRKSLWGNNPHHRTTNSLK